MKRWLGFIILVTIILPYQVEANLPQERQQFHEILRIGTGRIKSLDWNQYQPLILVNQGTGVVFYDEDFQNLGNLPNIHLARFSSDGKYIAGVNQANQLVLFDALSRQKIQTLSENLSPIVYLEWSPQSTYIVTIDQEATLTLWDFEKPLASRKTDNFFYVTGPSKFIAEWSPSGKMLAYPAEGGIVVINVDDLNPRHRMYFPKYKKPTEMFSQLEGLLWLSDKVLVKKVLSFDRNFSDCYEIEVIALDTLATNAQDFCDIKYLSLTNDGIFLTTQDTLTLLDINDFSVQQSSPNPLGISIHIMKQATEQGWLFLYNGTLYLIARSNLSYQGITTDVYGLMVGSIKDERILVIRSDGVLEVLDLATHTATGSLNLDSYAPYTFDLSDTGKHLAIVGKDAISVDIWDIDQQQVRNLPATGTRIGALAWRPDSPYWSAVQMLAIRSSDGIVVWNVNAGQPLLNFALEPHTNLTLNWEPNGRFLAMHSFYNQIIFWSAVSGRLWVVDDNHYATQHQLIWSPTGSNLAFADWLRPATVFNFPEFTATPIAIFNRPFYPNNAVFSWSNDGQAFRVALYNSGRSPLQSQIYDVTLETIFSSSDEIIPPVILKSQSFITELRWSPDGSMIATVNSDGLLHIWDTTTGEEIFFTYLLAPIDKYRPYSYFDWSPDNRFLVLDNSESTAIFEIPTEKLFQVIPHPQSLVNSINVDWSNDSRILALSIQGILSVWGLEE